MRDMHTSFGKPSDFFGKYIVVMGLGLHGGGVAVAQWLYAQGARVCVTDLRSERDLLSSVRAVRNFCGDFAVEHPDRKTIPIEWVLGEHRSEDMARADLIIQNPGVPYSSPYLSLARTAGVPIMNEIMLFLFLTQKTPKIGVTGTRGKSTTVALIHSMLLTAYPRAVCVGIAGVGMKSFFSVIDTVLEHEAEHIADPVVMELSSYQLELFSKESIVPHISVVTNVLSDHLNRHATLEAYSEIKERIVRFQGAHDYAILNYDNSETHAMGKRYRNGTRWWFSRTHIFNGPGAFLMPDSSGNSARRMIGIREEDGAIEKVCFTEERALLGEHTIENILAAAAAARCTGVPIADIAETIRTFRGLPFRQEKIANIQGRIWINDTAATSPDATIAALHTFGSEKDKHIILIAGGADKDLDFTNLASVVTHFVKSIILLSGTATPRLADALHRAGFSGGSMYANSMHDAVVSAYGVSGEGDVVLLSPGCASFGMFIHEFDRGEQFVREVGMLQSFLKML